MPRYLRSNLKEWILMLKKQVRKKIFVLSVVFLLTPLSASSMEIIFDKTYNISRKANLTTLNWRSVKFNKTPSGRVKYELTAEHPEGVQIEYLRGVNESISKAIKEKMVGSYDVPQKTVKFDENGAAVIVLDLPYDFETRYLPIKVVKKNGYEDYIVRLRFGDYRFLVANKVLNRFSSKDVSNIASRDHNELYRKRRQLKRRIVITKEQGPAYTVDELYNETQQARGIATHESAATENQAQNFEAEASGGSLFDEFESLAQQYGTEAVEKEEVQADAPTEQELADTLPEKDAETQLVSVGDMSLDDLSEETVSSLNEQNLDNNLETETRPEEISGEISEETSEALDGFIVVSSEGEVIQRFEDVMQEEPVDESSEVSSSSFEEALKAAGSDEEIESLVEGNEVEATDPAVEDIAMVDEDSASIPWLEGAPETEVTTESTLNRGVSSTSSGTSSSPYDVSAPQQTWNFVYSKGFEFQSAKAELESESSRVPASEEENIDEMSFEDLHTPLSFEDEEALGADKKKD